MQGGVGQGLLTGARVCCRSLSECVRTVGAAISRPQTVDKPIQNKSDSHGESARGDGNPLSRYNLCKNQLGGGYQPPADMLL